MNPHNLKFDERPWLYLLCAIPLILCLFPVPLALPIAYTMTIIEDECSVKTKIVALSIFYGWLAIGILLIYLNQRTPKSNHSTSASGTQ